MRYALKFMKETGLQLETEGRVFYLGRLKAGESGVDFEQKIACIEGAVCALHPGDCLNLANCRMIYLGGASALLQMGRIKAILTDAPQGESMRALEADFSVCQNRIFSADGEMRLELEKERAYSVYEIMEIL